MEDPGDVTFAENDYLTDSQRFFAPELCSANGVLSVRSDIFAYGMTVLEVGSPRVE